VQAVLRSSTAAAGGGTRSRRDLALP